MSGKSVAFALTLPAFSIGLAIGEPVSHPDLSRIEKLTGAKGSVDAQGGVVRVSLRHLDLAPRRPQVRIAPRLGPESWVLFGAMDELTRIEGALAVPEYQVDSTMSAALDAGLEIVALEQRFEWDHPNILRLQIRGTGTEEALATAVGTVFAKMRQSFGPRRELSTVLSEPVRSGLVALVEAGLGVKGELTEGVYRVSLDEESRGAQERGAATWAAFTGSLSRAVVAGDIVVEEAELQALLRRLRAAGFSVAAIEPEIAEKASRTLRVHYWGAGQGQALVEGVQSALSRASRAPGRGR